MNGPIDRIKAAIQDHGKQYAIRKLPLWAADDRIIYPCKLPLEQCSSEETAQFKASLVHGGCFADLCGGFGVDSVFFSRRFKKGFYIEQNPELFNCAMSNFKVLGCDNVECLNTTAEKYVAGMPPCDLIYMDPARRDSSGKKVFLLQDCSPDITALKTVILAKCKMLMLKLSPLIDIKAVLQQLPGTFKVYVVSLRNECKEILLLLNGEDCPDPEIHCVNLPCKQDFSFHQGEEENACACYSDPLDYLYEPNASILKAGAFKIIANTYGLGKLHPNSHLYTSGTLVSGFPGRIFKVCGIHPAKASFCKDLDKANLAVRNFPCKTEELKRKLKIKDGGELYIFATTLANGKHVIIRCHKTA